MQSRLHPISPRAYAGLADSLIMLTSIGPMSPTEAKPKAKDAALKALSLDAGLAEAHSSLGLVLQEYEFDFTGAEREFQRAIELSPNNPIARQAYGTLLTELERHDEAEAQFQKMLEVDPLSVVGKLDL
jgi:tetratricopeptide (TPR) repeat protein